MGADSGEVLVDQVTAAECGVSSSNVWGGVSGVGRHTSATMPMGAGSQTLGRVEPRGQDSSECVGLGPPPTDTHYHGPEAYP